MADGTRGKCVRSRFAAIIGAALVTAAVLVAQGCAPSATTAGPAAARPAVTIATASRVFAAYIRTSDAAAASGDEALALSVTAGVQWAQVRSEFLAAARDGTKPPRYRYGAPAFYVPRLGSFPEWFVVAVPLRGPAGTLAGLPVAASGAALLTFERSAATGPWRLTGTVRFAPGTALPALTRDGAGYATAVATSGGTLLSPPDVVGPLQAAVVDDGPASAAARVVAAGPLTTGLHAVQAARAAQDTRAAQGAGTSAGAGAASAGGASGEWQLEGAGFTEFALRTPDGGALVLYSMYLTATAAPRLTLEFAATDPPAAGAGHPAIRVIGFGGLGFSEIPGVPVAGNNPTGSATRPTHPPPGAASSPRPRSGSRGTPPTSW